MDVPEGTGAAGQAQGGVQDGASLRRGGPGEGQLQAGQQGPLRVHQPPLHAAAGGAGPLDMVGPAPLQQGPGQGAQPGEGLVQRRGGAEVVIGEHQGGLPGRQGLPHHQLVPLGGELPVDRAQGVPRPVVPQIVVLPRPSPWAGEERTAAGAAPQQAFRQRLLHIGRQDQHRRRPPGGDGQGEQAQQIAGPGPLRPADQPAAVGGGQLQSGRSAWCGAHGLPPHPPARAGELVAPVETGLKPGQGQAGAAAQPHLNDRVLPLYHCGSGGGEKQCAAQHRRQTQQHRQQGEQQHQRQGEGGQVEAEHDLKEHCPAQQGRVGNPTVRHGVRRSGGRAPAPAAPKQGRRSGRPPHGGRGAAGGAPRRQRPGTRPPAEHSPGPAPGRRPWPWR